MVDCGGFYSGTVGWGTAGGGRHAVAKSVCVGGGGEVPGLTGRRRVTGNVLATVHGRTVSAE
jgi:hypothetical protein